MFVEEKRQGEAQVTIEPWRQVMLDAADLIEREGWWNGDQAERARARKYEGKEIYCAVTALSSLEVVPLGEAYRELSVAIGRQGFYSIPEWNDRSTKEIVVATMRQVARSDHQSRPGDYLRWLDNRLPKPPTIPSREI